MRKAGFLFLLAALAACGEQSAADHETLGDRAYAVLDFAGALVEYRLEIVQDEDDKILRAKAGTAALRAGDLLAAAEEFSALVELDDEDIDGAEGLARVASASVLEGNREALNVALNALFVVREDRVHREFAAEMAAGLDISAQPARLLQLLPAAAATAANPGVSDSLVYQYARIMVRARNCAGAVAVFESLVRRDRNPEVAGRAAIDLARCALASGNRELSGGHPREAVDWFERAIIGGGGSPYAAAAYVGLGDALFAQGDFGGAFEAYLGVLDLADPDDRLYRQAITRLNDIGNAGSEEEKEEF